jgi:DNA-binding transcriptional ArsR family regulator
MKYRNKSLNDIRPILEIDRLIHEPARFSIMAHLYVVESADFLFLERQTGLTKGNLSSHLSKLEIAGYVTINKEFVEKIPRTLISLSRKGSEAFKKYLSEMKWMLKNFES